MVLRTLGALALQLIGVVAAFAWHVSVTNRLGAATSGTLFLAVSLATTLGVLTRFGGETYLVSAIAQAVASGNFAAVRRQFGAGLAVSVIAVVVLSVVAMPLSTKLGGFFDGADSQLLVALSLGLLMAANLYTLSSAALRGIGAVEASVVVLSVLPHLAAVSFFWAAGAHSLGDASAALLVGWLSAGLAGVALAMRRAFTPELHGTSPGTYIRSAAGLYKVAVAQMLINSSAPLLVGALSNPHDVALFTTASRITQVVSLIQVAINTVFGPRIVADLVEGQSHAAFAHLVKSAKIAATVGLSFLLALIIFGSRILGLFGPEFHAGRPYMMLLAVGQFLNVSAGCLGYALLLTSFEDLVRRNVVTFGLLFAVGALLGGWLFGGVGVAAATALTLGTQNVALFIAARRSVPWLTAGRGSV